MDNSEHFYFVTVNAASNMIFFQESARENEIIQLYEKMARENAKREAEIDELRAR